MKRTEYQYKIELLKKLIVVEQTGTPTELGDKLNVSERTIRRMINDIREEGLIVRYNKWMKTYYYSLHA